MKRFQIEITETLQRIVEVEAETVEEALSKVEDDYVDHKINLFPDTDLKNFSIKEYKE